MTTVRILAWIHTLLGGAGLVLGTWACLTLLADPEGGAALYYIGPIFGFLAVLYFAPGFLGGVGVLLGKPWGRWILIALSFVLLLAIPIGTVLGGFGLWALLRKDGLPKVGPTAPRTSSTDAQSSEKTRRKIDLLLVIVATGSAMAAGMTIAFWAHDDMPPPELRAVFYPALAILAAVTVVIVTRRPFRGWGGSVRTINPIRQARWRRRMHREIETWKAERAARVAALSADPALKPYADRITAGEVWSDAQIAYDRDRSMLATCRHLRPIETAMRGRGLYLRLEGAEQVTAQCRIDEAALWTEFPKGKLLYAELFRGGRAVEDDPEAYLFCEACRSRIDVIHPVLWREEIPRFPAPQSASRR
jgi:hypothetical protein